jgi:UDP-N-acetylglucosamine acyltransferase
MTASIHPTAIVADGARLGDGVQVGPYSIVGSRVTLGDGVRLMSHVVVEGLTSIGEGSIVHPFACLGAAPQHLGHKGEDTRLVLGARNIVREHVTMHAGTSMGRGVTTVGDDGLFMVGAHVAHDCIVGNKVVFANNATLGGHVEVGDFVFMGGLCAVHQYTRIGRYAFVGGAAGVAKDVIPYGSVWGNHAHLEGLINDLRAAYRLLFADEGTFQERLEDVARVFAHSEEVGEIITFIRADASRSLCMPSGE